MMTKEEILNAAKKWEDFCIALRRDFHESPELSGQETQTIARICTELRAVGLSPIEVQDGGVLAVIEGDAPGKTVLLRADVDALPVQEDPCNLCARKNVSARSPACPMCAAMTAMQPCWSLWGRFLQPVGIFLGELCSCLNAVKKGAAISGISLIICKRTIGTLMEFGACT